MFPFQGKAPPPPISDHSGSSKRFEPLPPVLRVWLSGANLWCTALLSLEEPAPLSQRPGCGAESNGNTAEDSVRPGYSTWWGSRTRGAAQQLLGSLGTLEKLLLGFGSHRKGLEQVSLLELKPIPSSCLNNTAFLSQFSLALSWAPACCSFSEGQERSTGVAEARSCCPQSNGGPPEHGYVMRCWY